MGFSELDEQLLHSFDPAEVAIIKTIVYADIFNYPLTFEELCGYLIAPLPVGRDILQAKAEILVGKGLLNNQRGFYLLPHRGDIITLRRNRILASKKKWRKVAAWGHLFKLLPWLKLLGVSGALAMDNSDDDDDIDLLFVTADQRLWLTRFVVVLIFKITGQYRQEGRIKNRFCPNLFISDTAIGNFKHNLYVAHEVAQLRPVWDRDNLYLRFLAANNWVGSFLPNTLMPPPPTSPQRNGRLPLAFIFDHLENLARQYQLRYMDRRKTIEVTTEQLIFLHPRDTTNQVMKIFNERLRRFLPT